MTAPKKPSAPRSTRNKAQLAEELTAVSERLEDGADIDPTAAQVAARRRQEVLSLASTACSQGVVQHLSSIGLEVQSSLDGVKNLMMTAVQDLTALKEAKAALEKEVEELHGKEVVAANLKQLLDNLESQKLTAASEYHEQVQAFNENLTKLKRDEETLKAELETSRKREEEEYEYARTQARRKLEDDFAVQHERRVKALMESEESLKKGWAEREAALRAQEQTVAELTKSVEAFPAELEAAKKTAEAATAKSLHGEYGHKIAITEANNKAALGLAEQTIKSLQAKIGDQDLVIKALQDKLDRAEYRVETIAKSALDSASGRHALEAAQSTMAISRDNSPTSRKS